MPTLTQTKAKAKINTGLAIGIIAVCAVGATVAVGYGVISGGLAGVVTLPGSVWTCSESNETANNVNPASIPYLSSFNSSTGGIDNVSFFDIYNQSTASCSKGGSRSAYSDVCLIDVCTGTSCKSTATSTCGLLDKNCRLQEGFIKNATSTTPTVSNWLYKCPNGCSNGACVVKTWRKINNVAPQNYMSAVLSGNGQYQVLGGAGGNIQVTSDFGKNWSGFAGPIESYNSIAISNDGKYWTVVATQIGIYVSNGSDLTLKPLNKGWQDVDMSNNGKYQTAVTNEPNINDAAIFVSNDYGATWVIKNTGDKFRYVSVSGDGKYQAVDAYRSLYLSSDYGNTWEKKAIPDLFYRVFLSNDGSGQLAFAEGSGKIYKSVDYGTTWSLVNNTFRPHGGQFPDIAVSRDLLKVFAVSYDGYIYTSQDSGKNWLQEESNRHWINIATSADGSRAIAGIYSEVYTWP